MSDGMDATRLGQIRLISARYHELQGLRAVCGGAAIAIAFGTTADRSSVAYPVLIFLALTAPCQWWLNRYYAATFGRQVPTRDRYGLRASLLVVGAVALLDGLLQTGPFVAAAVIAGVYSLWMAIRDWPFRKHHLGAGMVAPFGLAMHLGLIGSGTSAQTTTVTMGLLGVMWMVAGFFDHRLLVRLMTRREMREWVNG